MSLVADSSGNGRDGDLTADGTSPLPTLGVPGGTGGGTAYEWTSSPAVNAKVIVPANAAFDTPAFTVEAVIKTPLKDGGADRHILDRRTSALTGHFSFFVFGSSGQVGLYVYKENQGAFGGVSNGRVDDDVYHHVAGVYQRSTGAWAIFIDGVKTSGSDPAGITGGTGMPTVLGRLQDANSRYWRGSLDDVALFPTNLSDARVQAHASAMAARSGYAAAILTDSPSGYWKLDEGAAPAGGWSVGSIRMG